jgi:two-component system, response regulator
MTADPKTVLVVDDSDNDVALLKFAFDEIKFPYNVEVARDGQEAIDYLWATGQFAARDRTQSPVLVILDLKMPRVGGIEVLRRMREDKQLKHVVVMILTSSDEEKDKAEGLRLGVDLYVRKPADFEDYVGIAKRVAELIPT